MRNSIIIILFFLFKNLYAENISIEANNISLDNNDNTSIFENEVVVKTKDKTIYSDYAKYNKKKGILILKKNIIILDEKKNEIKTEYAEYLENDEIIFTKGLTLVKTQEKYLLTGKDLFFDNKKKLIKSDQNSILQDQDKNKIYLENFEYFINTSLFKSVGLTEIQDNKKNIYKFSQVYIDTKRKEILGTDSKVFINNDDFKLNEKNNPRVFSNSVNIKTEKSTFDKSIFTLCQFRENDDCPPWTIQSKKMIHDNAKKTIFYKNAVVKVYDFPIFYFPLLSHPDPTVDRRSGFLIPSIYNTKNFGSGVSVPYFFDLGIDKNLTITNRLYVEDNPLILGEYHQAFLDSNLMTDFGFTEEKSHFFGNFVKIFNSNSDYENTLEIKLQEVSNDKYLKLYKIESNLVDYNVQTLENSINFTQERENLFFGFNASVYETIQSDYNDKYEFILPELAIDKNLFSDDRFGSLGLQTNYRTHNYDTNKKTSFLVNDLNYESRDNLFNNLINTKILANFKNINYESKNVDIYKDDLTSEVFGALGFLSEIKLQKLKNDSFHSLKPKFLMRFSPGSMRKETDGSRLTPSNAFEMNKVEDINNFETGISSTYGFDYKLKNNDITKFDFSLAQIISEKENKKMSEESSLNEKLSDLVGESVFHLTDNFKINYNFSIDQNYNDFNYNETGVAYDNGTFDLNFNYLSENKHIGDQEYFKTELSLKNKEKGLLSFSAKRNLVTDSSEFYNLGYEYINDCLKAGLVYRREFYNDSEAEPEDSLMFKLTLIPFGDI